MKNGKKYSSALVDYVSWTDKTTAATTTSNNKREEIVEMKNERLQKKISNTK
jgi:hypothetical protein